MFFVALLLFMWLAVNTLCSLGAAICYATENREKEFSPWETWIDNICVGGLEIGASMFEEKNWGQGCNRVLSHILLPRFPSNFFMKLVPSLSGALRGLSFMTDPQHLFRTYLPPTSNSFLCAWCFLCRFSTWGRTLSLIFGRIHSQRIRMQMQWFNRNSNDMRIGGRKLPPLHSPREKMVLS